ncbi:MAG: hypothetical protein DRO67_07545 [Candidatus Asgardarchaeum californiense]|nr:MAG: hypothetical protein DRO67_07545 [Candidatus Asgardarchaeum californiense]
MEEYTIGTDPEFFLKKGDSYVSAIPFIKGSKHDPKVLPSGGTIQRDNVAVEFATVPAENGKDFVNKVKDCLKDTIDIIPEGYELVVEPSATFPESELEDPEACEFGCDPDFNAYLLSENEKPWCEDSTFRSCGAHIHVGCLNDKGEPTKGLEFLIEFHGKIETVKAMDLLHGIISTILDNSLAATQRRELYGKAGCHRPTKYGVEYRVLSNYWMKSPELVMLMNSLTKDALSLVSSGKLKEVLNLVTEDEVQDVINNGKVEKANEIVKKHIEQYLSSDSKDLFKLCKDNMKKYKTVKEEWGL